MRKRYVLLSLIIVAAVLTALSYPRVHYAKLGIVVEKYHRKDCGFCVVVNVTRTYPDFVMIPHLKEGFYDRIFIGIHAQVTRFRIPLFGIEWDRLETWTKLPL